MKKNESELSAFGRAALLLDGDFQELESLRGSIERLEIASDSGLERAKTFLPKFADCGRRIAEGVQEMARALEVARQSAEASATLVAARANEVQARLQENDRLYARFQAIGETVREVTAETATLKETAAEKMSDESKASFREKLPALDARLDSLAVEAARLKKDAHEANMRTLEREADSLAQSLQSARRKLGAFVVRSTNAH